MRKAPVRFLASSKVPDGGGRPQRFLPCQSEFTDMRSNRNIRLLQVALVPRLR